LTKQADLDFDRKEPNYVLKKRKKEKKKGMTLNTALPPTRRQSPNTKAQRRRVCGSANVLYNQKSSRSSIKEANKNLKIGIN
jgi:hypothetical protein